MSERRITIRLSQDEFTAIEAQANRRGTTIADTVRAAVQTGMIIDHLALQEQRIAERIAALEQRIPFVVVDEFERRKKAAIAAQNGH